MPTIERLRPVVRPHSYLTPRLEQRASTFMARNRLETELRLIALDLLCPGERSELPPEAAEWVGEAATEAVSAVLDGSIRTLVQTLRTIVAGASPEVIHRLDQAALRYDAVID